MRLHIILRATAALATIAMATTADAKCTKMAFSVNDYGKEGPSNDAKMLLDKHIAKWTADHGVKKYTTGKKEVTCELFLDFGVFDEHTCKAEASVCWTGSNPVADAAADAAKTTKVAKPRVAPAAKPKT